MALSEKDVLDMVRQQNDEKMSKLQDTYGQYMATDEPEEDKVVDPDDEEKDDDDGDSDDEEPKKPEHLKVDTTMDGLLSRGLRLRHKDSDLEYTVLSVSPRDAILMTPEGKPFTVSAEEINQDYELD